MRQRKAGSAEAGLGRQPSAELLRVGLGNAVLGLSKMSGREIRITDLNLRSVPVREVPELFGGPEALVVATYLKLCGYAGGHILMIYQPRMAFEMVDLVLGQAPGSTKGLTEWEQSVLAEVGNIMGSHFLNYLADNAGVGFRPSPPVVMTDMCGAILDAPLSSILACSDATHIAEASFETDDQQFRGNFIVLAVPTLPDASQPAGQKAGQQR